MVKKVDTICEGEIYIYVDRDEDYDDRIVCHRLIKIDNGVYFFKGDNRKNMDAPVPFEDIIGMVVL